MCFMKMISHMSTFTGYLKKTLFIVDQIDSAAF